MELLWSSSAGTPQSYDCPLMWAPSQASFGLLLRNANHQTLLQTQLYLPLLFFPWVISQSYHFISFSFKSSCGNVEVGKWAPRGSAHHVLDRHPSDSVEGHICHRPLIEWFWGPSPGRWQWRIYQEQNFAGTNCTPFHWNRDVCRSSCLVASRSALRGPLTHSRRDWVQRSSSWRKVGGFHLHKVEVKTLCWTVKKIFF